MKALSVAPVLRVSRLDEAVRHYTGVLGFKEDFRFGEYAGVTLGEATIHLCSHNFQERAIGQGAVFVFCDAIDGYCEEIRQKGARIRVEPEDRPYGMRDFTVLDPDGNCLNFGCEVAKPHPTT